MGSEMVPWRWPEGCATTLFDCRVPVFPYQRAIRLFYSAKVVWKSASSNAASLSARRRSITLSTSHFLVTICDFSETVWVQAPWEIRVKLWRLWSEWTRTRCKEEWLIFITIRELDRCSFLFNYCSPFWSPLLLFSVTEALMCCRLLLVLVWMWSTIVLKVDVMHHQFVLPRDELLSSDMIRDAKQREVHFPLQVKSEQKFRGVCSNMKRESCAKITFYANAAN